MLQVSQLLLQMLANRCIESLGEDFEVEFATDGREALEVVGRIDVDLVVTDLRMPEIDGLELVKRLREEHPLVPVILMTARGSEQIAVKALAAGAASYVPKDQIKSAASCSGFCTARRTSSSSTTSI